MGIESLFTSVGPPYLTSVTSVVLLSYRTIEKSSIIPVRRESWRPPRHRLTLIYITKFRLLETTTNTIMVRIQQPPIQGVSEEHRLNWLNRLKFVP